MDITPDEMMVFCMARQVQDGEIVAQGLATPLVAAAYLLARHTHAPNLYFTSAIGQGICRQPAPLGLTRVESLWLDRSMNNVGFVQAAADILPRLRPKEFFRPAQVDPAGNFNNLAFGSDYRRPRLRLPGSGGIPDVTTYIDDIHLYVPRHSRLTFVEQLDFISGMGHNPRRQRGSGPRYLVSDLGQFDFSGGTPDQPRMRLTSYHPGVDVANVQAHTGFPIEVAPDVHQTPLPDPAELRLLRQEIDPLGIRKLEALSGAGRRQLLHEIIASEAADSTTNPKEVEHT
jgi:acyl CoA:acetate/3-ketoacid CoA transferase beta subunit